MKRLTKEREAAIREKVAKGYGCCEWDLLEEIDALRVDLENKWYMKRYVNVCNERDRFRETLEFYAKGEHLSNKRLCEDSVRMTQQGLIETGWRARVALNPKEEK